MKIRFSNKNTVIHYTIGMTDADIISILKRRIEKRSKELEKRKWIVDEYNSLMSLQLNDDSWLYSFEKGGFSIEPRGNSND